MKKVVMTVVGILALAGTANAQGTWYTNQAEWLNLVTNVQTANYTTQPSGSSPLTEADVTATAASGSWSSNVTGTFTTVSATPVTFTFSGNAFGGMFSAANSGHQFNYSILGFAVDAPSNNTQSLNTNGFTHMFLGYISNSASPISVTVSPDNAGSYLTVDSFSFGQSKTSLGSSVAPEPGTLALALTGGCALVGFCIRRRKAA
jgi:hypothetical protein